MLKIGLGKNIFTNLQHLTFSSDSQQILFFRAPWSCGLMHLLSDPEVSSSNPTAVMEFYPAQTFFHYHYFNNLKTNAFANVCMYATDGMFCMNGTTSVPKSVLRYIVDKVRQGSEFEVCNQFCWIGKNCDRNGDRMSKNNGKLQYLH